MARRLRPKLVRRMTRTERKLEIQRVARERAERQEEIRRFEEEQQKRKEEQLSPIQSEISEWEHARRLSLKSNIVIAGIRPKSLREKELHRIKFLRRPDSLTDYKPEEVYFEASIFDLITAFKTALKDIPKDIFFEVIKDEFTVEQKLHDILHLLLVNSVIELNQLFLKAKNKLEIVATFLAILELIRLKEIAVFQEGLFGKIVVARGN